MVVDLILRFFKVLYAPETTLLYFNISTWSGVKSGVGIICKKKD
jgi:hypothetical protein